MNKALLTGRVATLASMTGCSDDASDSASAASSYSGPPVRHALGRAWRMRRYGTRGRAAG